MLGNYQSNTSTDIRWANGADHPEYAHRVLSDMGAGADDLVVGITEGGETPFVLGAVDWGRLHCRRHPWLLYCNPNQVIHY